MSNKYLLVIAGCNGAGKSSFSKDLAPLGVVPFDYDFQFLKCYETLIESEMREVMAHNKTFTELERQVEESIKTGQAFCYETNFNSTPMFWPQKFRAAGYTIDMIFFCLDSVLTAKQRVAIRVESGGHFVPEKEIEIRYGLGYRHLDLYFKEFDNIHILDSSHYNSAPIYCFSVQNGMPLRIDMVPNFLKERIPNLLAQLNQKQ